MAKGPSPLIPLLLVLTLGLLLHGQCLINTVSLAEDINLTFFLVIPLLAILLVHYTTQSIMLPLSVILLTYTVSKILIGPLVLVIIIYLASFYAPSLQGNNYQQSRVYGHEDGFGGWGLAMLVFLFFLLIQLF